MRSEAFVTMQRGEEIEVLPLILCKDCACHEDPQAIISEFLPCQFCNTPENWFCASGRKRNDKD